MAKVPVEKGDISKSLLAMHERESEPPLLQVKSRGAVIVIMDAVSQLANVATLPARLLIFTGSI